MILRRFMQHVKEQNWFAVGLDVCVVIVGIFLGMQVTDWNEERKAQADADVYFDRLVKDVSRARENVLGAIDFYKEKQRRGFLVLEVLDGAKLTDNNKLEFEEGLRSLPYLSQAQLHVGALGQLLDGTLPPLFNTARQAQAIALQDDLIFRQRTLKHIEYRLDAQVPLIDRTVASSLMNGEQEIPFVYDLEAMRASQEYRILVQTVSHTTANILTHLERMLESLDQFLVSPHQ